MNKFTLQRQIDIIMEQLKIAMMILVPNPEDLWKRIACTKHNVKLLEGMTEEENP